MQDLFVSTMYIPLETSKVELSQMLDGGIETVRMTHGGSCLTKNETQQKWSPILVQSKIKVPALSRFKLLTKLACCFYDK